MVSRIVVPSLGEIADQRPELPPSFGVEPGGGLVEEEEFGPPDDPERDVDAPPLPAGERLDPRLGLLGEPDLLDHLVRIARVRVVLREVADGLGNTQLGGIVRGLQHDADLGAPFPPGLAGVFTEHGHLATGPLPVTFEDLDGGGLPGTVGPEQGENLTLGDVQIQPGHREVTGVLLAQAAHAHCCGHGSSLVFMRVDSAQRATESGCPPIGGQSRRLGRVLAL